jgi:hypothetical protein
MSNTVRESRRYVIVCNDENRPISNVRSEEMWSTLDDLIALLVEYSDFADVNMLFSWKKKANHNVSPKEVYAWRAALEEIKNSNLFEKSQKFLADNEKFVLITDKPTMLKIAGEITNCLQHSYTSRHKISFVTNQSASKDPSSLAL